LTEGRQVIGRTRDALGTRLKQQELLEPILRHAPEHAARLASELPQVGQSLSRVLRGAGPLREVAKSLRQTQQGLATATAHWPELRLALRQGSRLLEAAGGQFDQVLAQQEQYELALRRSTELAESLAETAPAVAGQMLARLDEQDRALADLQRQLDEAGASVPAYSRSAADVLTASRLLAWLLAVAVGLHGAALLADGLRRRSAEANE
jgi:hypothetical protein